MNYKNITLCVIILFISSCNSNNLKDKVVYLPSEVDIKSAKIVVNNYYYYLSSQFYYFFYRICSKTLKNYIENEKFSKIIENYYKNTGEYKSHKIVSYHYNEEIINDELIKIFEFDYITEYENCKMIESFIISDNENGIFKIDGIKFSNNTINYFNN